MLKKFLSIAFSIALVFVVGVSCSSNKNNNQSSDNNVVEAPKTEETEQKTEETEQKEESSEPTMTVQELNEAMKSQPLKVINTRYYPTDTPNLKRVYPDIIASTIQNNSGTVIKDAVIGFVAWDEDNKPVKLKGTDARSFPKYYIEVDYDNINLEDGATYGEDVGAAVDNDNIAKARSIVVYYIDSEGNKWENPLLKEFKKLYSGKELVE